MVQNATFVLDVERRRRTIWARWYSVEYGLLVSCVLNIVLGFVVVLQARQSKTIVVRALDSVDGAMKDVLAATDLPAASFREGVHQAALRKARKLPNEEPERVVLH